MSNGRLGLLVPSSNTVMEVDFYRGLPASVTLHTARMFLEDVTVEAETTMMERYAPAAARAVGTVRPHVVVFGCTSASAVLGQDGDARLRERLAKEAGAPVVAVMASVLEALDLLGAESVAVVTPYVEDLSERVADALCGHGLRIAALHGMGIVRNTDIARVPPEDIAAFVSAKLAGCEADCAFVSCTNFRAMDALRDLRSSLGIPVITSNEAALRTAIRLLGHSSPILPSTSEGVV